MLVPAKICNTKVNIVLWQSNTQNHAQSMYRFQLRPGSMPALSLGEFFFIGICNACISNGFTSIATHTPGPLLALE